MADSRDGRYQFIITEGAKGDMRACAARDKVAASEVAMLLRELYDDERSCQQLVDEHYSDEVIEGVEPLRTMQELGINAYRIRFYAMGRWRMITGVDHQSRSVAIMAIMPRGADYEKDVGLWQRIKDEYDSIGLRRI